jgi:hypothetical protein
MLEEYSNQKGRSDGQKVATVATLLINEACESMRARGHSPEPASIYTGGAIVYCKTCKMSADIVVKPQPNGIQISGEAVALNCNSINKGSNNQKVATVATPQRTNRPQFLYKEIKDCSRKELERRCAYYERITGALECTLSLGIMELRNGQRIVSKMRS